MTRATVRQEVRPLRFEALYERRQRRTLTMAEAAELLEITERTVRRWSGRYATEGAEGTVDTTRLTQGASRCFRPIHRTRGGKTRKEELDRSWAIYTGQGNLLSTQRY